MPEWFLDGITRRSVMSLARRQQMKVVERDIEAWGAGAGERGVPGGDRGRGDAGAGDRGRSFTPGRITETLLRDYDMLVRQAPAEVAKVVAA